MTDTSVHHDVHRDGMERHDWQMTPAHGASDEQGHDIEPSLLSMKEKKDPATLEAFFSLVLLLFLLCNPCFPFAYKRESRAPHEGGVQICTRPNHEIKAQEHDTSTRLSNKRALSTRSFLPPET